MLGFRKRRIYLDYASATPLAGEVARAMREAQALSGNPGSIHAEGAESRRALKEAREGIARELGAKPRQIVCTSGLTESNNLAIMGHARSLERRGAGLKGTHWITSSIEHDSVLECFSEIERLGGSVSHVDPGPRGIVGAAAILRALREHTVFISIGWANNEIGTIQPLSQIARVIHDHAKLRKSMPLFHSDAGQAPLYLSPQVHTLGIDFFSIGGSKLHGPRSAGALYVRDPAQLSAIHLGGAQEGALRAGTEDVVSAVGLAQALEVASRMREPERARIRELRDNFARDIIARLPGGFVNGDLARALPHMLNISIPDINAEYLTLALDREGVAVSTKSACRASEKTSRVVASLGGPPWRAENTLRLSLGRETTERDCARAAEAIARLSAQAR